MTDHSDDVSSHLAAPSSVEGVDTERDDAAPSRGGTVRRVLIADDDDDFREALRACVEHDEGFSAQEARDGNEALDLAMSTQPDILVVDHRMPGLTGIEVVRKLRASGAGTAIVFITAANDVRGSRATRAYAGSSESPSAASSSWIS